MKHSLNELVDIAHRYYPRGSPNDEPRPDTSEESLRLVAARLHAGADYEPWRAMLRRLREKFPERQVEDRAFHLPSGQHDACYSAQLNLPTTAPGEHWHYVGFLVSFVVPYYIIYSRRCVDVVEVREAPTVVERNLDIYIGDTCIVTPIKVKVLLADQRPRQQLEVSFGPSPDEQPYFAELAQEIDATFKYERMPPEVGQVIVPDVTTGGRYFGEATLYDCLFLEELSLH